MSGENKGLSIKGSKQNIKMSTCFIGFAVSAVIGIIVRYLQMVKFIDSKTGFYVGGEAATIILYAVLAIAIFFFCGVCSFYEDSKSILQ